MSAYHLHAITPALILQAVLYAPVTVGMNWLLMEDLVMVGSSSDLLCLINHM